MNEMLAAGLAGMAGVAIAALLRELWVARTLRRLQTQHAINGTVVGTQPMQGSEQSVAVGYVVDYTDVGGQSHRLTGARSRRPLKVGERLEVRYPLSNPSLGSIYPVPIRVSRRALVVYAALAIASLALLAMFG